MVDFPSFLERMIAKMHGHPDPELFCVDLCNFLIEKGVDQSEAIAVTEAMFRLSKRSAQNAR